MALVAPFVSALTSGSALCQPRPSRDSTGGSSRFQLPSPRFFACITGVVGARTSIFTTSFRSARALLSKNSAASSLAAWRSAAPYTSVPPPRTENASPSTEAARTPVISRRRVHSRERGERVGERAAAGDPHAGGEPRRRGHAADERHAVRAGRGRAE